MKDGVTARDVYLHAANFVRERNPELEKHFVKNVGFGVSASTVSVVTLLMIFLRWEWNSAMLPMSCLPRMLDSSRPI